MIGFGMAWNGKARFGRTWQGRQGTARQNKVRLGRVGHFEARPAWRGGSQPHTAVPVTAR
jgi:hypothetical protein